MKSYCIQKRRVIEPEGGPQFFSCPWANQLSPFTGKRLSYYLDFATANDREMCRKTKTRVSFSMTFCYSSPSRTQISRSLLVHMSVKKSQKQEQGENWLKSEKYKRGTL